MSNGPNIPRKTISTGSYFENPPISYKRPPSQRVEMMLQEIDNSLANVQTDKEIEEISDKLGEVATIVEEEMQKSKDSEEYETDSSVLGEGFTMSDVRKRYIDK